MKIIKPFQLVLFSFIILMIACSKDSDKPNNGGGGFTSSGCSGGPSTVTDIDGNTYNVVQIGNQCWMKENLRTTRFRNGAAIPDSLLPSVWSAANNAAASDYDNNSANSVIYGRLYNWYAAADPAGLCPIGWHAPTDAEWNQLVIALDSTADTSFSSTVQSNVVGGMIKDTGNIQSGTGLWQSPNVATNSSLFTAIPGGARDFSGTFTYLGQAAYWWTAGGTYGFSEDWVRFVANGNSRINRTVYDKRNGLSVRCVRD